MNVSIFSRLKKNQYVKSCINSNIVTAVAINLLFFILILLFCDMKYEVSDDFVMANVLSGAYSDTQNPQIIFINVLWGYFLMPFYKLFPQISWYFVSQIVLIFYSSTIITYLLLKTLERSKAVMLSIILILFFTNDAYILVQFTKTAMFAIMSGGLFVINEIFGEQKETRLLFGSILCLIGTMLRFTTIYIAGGFLLFILIYEFFLLISQDMNRQRNKLIIVKIISVGAGLIIIAIGLKWIDWYTYNNDEPYCFFGSFNNARSHIVDYVDYGYDSYANELSEIGVSENDYYMMKTWGFADNDVFNLKKMEETADIIKAHYDNREVSWGQILESIQGRELTKYPVFLACGLLLILGIFFNANKWWTMLGSIGIGGSLFIYFAYRERSLYRIEYSVFLGIFLCGIYFWKFNKKNNAEFIVPKEKMSQICCIITSICVIWNSILYIPDNTYKSINSASRKNYIDSVFNQSWNYAAQKYRRVVNREKPVNGLIEEVSNNKQNFYFLDFTTTIQTLYFEWTPWETLPKGYYNNFLSLGGVTTNFPDEIKILKENNVENPLRALVNDNVYLVDNQYLEIKLTYLKEHYYPNVRAELYKEIDGYQIWKIYKE